MVGSLIKVDINTDGLGQAAGRLLEFIEKAMTGETRPARKIKHAHADAEVVLIKADAEIEADSRRQQAIRRLEAENIRHQRNIDRVISLSLPHLKEDARPESVDPDWFNLLIERARATSAEDVQELWARVLAGEVNSPGSFHKRTLTVISELERSEAEAFELLCRFVWVIDEPRPLIIRYAEDIYINNGLTYNRILELANAGLIHTESTLRLSRKESAAAKYFGRAVVFRPREGKDTVEIPAGHVAFTSAGKQLLSLVSAQPIPEFVAVMLKYWEKQNPMLIP